MKSEIKGRPAFAYIEVELDPNDMITAESDAMSSMSDEITLATRTNGGFFKGLIKKFFAKESLFVNDFSNQTSTAQTLTLVQATPGDIMSKELKNETYYLQPGAYIASTPGVDFKVKWAGFTSWFAGEGLFRIGVHGTGTVWYGAYGGLIEKEIDGELIVDTNHLVAYEPHMKLKLQLSGSLFSSFFGGEGWVTRVEGKGKVIIQTRSLNGLIEWTNRNL